jgi:hypothetical protein
MERGVPVSGAGQTKAARERPKPVRGVSTVLSVAAGVLLVPAGAVLALAAGAAAWLLVVVVPLGSLRRGRSREGE